VIVLGIAAGCAPTNPEAQGKPIFYPPLPDVPRLQFLTSFSDLDAWGGNGGTSFTDFVVGAKKNERKKIVSPYGIAVWKARIYICDLAKHCVYFVDFANKTSGTLGTPDLIDTPVNIAIGADGAKYVCDTQKRMVAVFDAQDKYVRSIGDAARCTPISLAIRGDELFVVDVAGAKIEVWNKAGKLLRTISSKGFDPGQLNMPTNLAISPASIIYVANTGSSAVERFDVKGRYLKPLGLPGDRPGEFARPKGIAIDPKGIVYVADSQWNKVQIFSPEGQLLLYFGDRTAGPDSTDMPTGLAIDGSSLPYFRQYVSKDFDAEYLLFLTDEFGKNKISVIAFGNSNKAKIAATRPRPATRPATEPGK
jgi:DNA-binding beta-propeller fold protein YncE